MSVVLVDWLGRGGIAQMSEAWALELDRAGHPVEVVTRAGRELGSGAVAVHAAPAVPGRVRAHRAVVAAAATRIRETRPKCVVIQNYVIPTLERPVVRAARAAGAKVVLVVHDDKLHTWRAGTRAGMRGLLRGADRVVVHTEHVGAGVRAFAGRDDVDVIPLPVPLGLLRHPVEPFTRPPGGLVCAHFGVLHRKYKGTALVEDLARTGVPGWQFAVFGRGAPVPTSGLTTLPGYLSPGALVGAVSETDVTILPYRRATQSGAVVVAHVLGSVPVASAVGGIPEQIADGVDGILVPAAAGVDAWRDVLVRLADDGTREAMAAAGTARAWDDHARFVAAIGELVS